MYMNTIYMNIECKIQENDKELLTSGNPRQEHERPIKNSWKVVRPIKSSIKKKTRTSENSKWVVLRWKLKRTNSLECNTKYKKKT